MCFMLWDIINLNVVPGGKKSSRMVPVLPSPCTTSYLLITSGSVWATILARSRVPYSFQAWLAGTLTSLSSETVPNIVPFSIVASGAMTVMISGGGGGGGGDKWWWRRSQLYR